MNISETNCFDTVTNIIAEYFLLAKKATMNCFIVAKFKNSIPVLAVKCASALLIIKPYYLPSLAKSSSLSFSYPGLPRRANIFFL